MPILYISIVFPITEVLLFCKFYINRNKKTATKFSEKSDEKYISKLLLIPHISPIYQDAGHAERTKNQDTPFSTFISISIHCVLDGEIKDRWERGKDNTLNIIHPSSGDRTPNRRNKSNIPPLCCDDIKGILVIFLNHTTS